ncbi:protein LONGIFOLIA 2 [Lycium ferocissimum]|uniref:protein LONGIFOLIA 2 n=1 Tax=Lycium ferocissimum TaxID=112874 RepID=UPI002814CC5F|nr:protein LONGIFOLIA 2 [Lycium ferocissimum]XP_059303727.1 protein LONGIFOLIA 2 [Lycium ferocissimum]XP_059303728.1 protein LONGIFOLIA 2 [Lycium ferocissimum]
MAAKLLHSLSEDNQDLQKQIGCMTGILQLFDRQSMLNSRRLIGNSPKRLTSGSSHIGSGTSEKEYTNTYQRSPAMESHTNKTVQDKQRLSTDWSRPSFSSSSRSSSFSSLDCNKISQQEPLAFDRLSLPETPSREPAAGQPNASPQFGRQSLDIRDVVKDSMNREAQSFSMKEEVIEPMSKPGDSPRPADLKESLRVLAKLREAPWYSSEHRELTRSLSYHSKDTSSLSVSKDAPRFSYDGRETNHVPFESRDISNSKSTLKLKELPRLSLDSRVSPVRSLNSEPKSNFSSKSMQKDSGNNNAKSPTLLQTSGSQARPPSVVAKLMGLETLPDGMSSTDSKTVEEPVSFPRSSEVSDPCKPIRTSNSSKNLWKEPTSPRWRNPDMAMKPISRVSIEPAPWKQPDRTRLYEKPISRTTKAPVKPAHPFPSVYSEIEKRWKDLEFTHSGKDLRALKQILEAMQAKGFLETEKEEQGSNFTVQKEKFGSPAQSAKLANQKMRQSDQVTKRGLNSSKNFESPIVIMKPAKLVEKSDIPSSSMIPLDGLPTFPKLHGGDSVSRKGNATSRAAKEHQPRTSYGSSPVNPNEARRTSKPPQISTRSQQQLPRESTSGSIKSSGSISPRLQQNKLELEKRSRPPTPPSDSNRSRRQSNKQHTEASSPGGRRRPRISNIQHHDNPVSQISGQSNGNVVAESKVDSEVTSFECSLEVTSIQSSSIDTSNYLRCDLVEKKSTLLLSEDEPAPEYPSPVSVLDNAVYTDESPSPVKHTPKVMKDESCKIADKFSSPPPCDATNSGLSSEINRKKFQNIENLVEKLRRLNSNHDEARTDYIASLCENTNPDHRYISEILLASGLLLRDLGSSLTSFQFHPSGHPINPELFLVLEQTKASTLLKEEFCNDKMRQSKPKEKIRRKLIFDVVNESLAGKLVLVGPSYEPWLSSQKLAKSNLNAQRLLRDLCSEIEQLQAKPLKCSWEDEEDEWKNILLDDVMHRSESWTVFTGEISSVVLDVERMVFKDLVDEIVRGDGSGLRVKPTRRRQLFAK